MDKEILRLWFRGLAEAPQAVHCWTNMPCESSLRHEGHSCVQVLDCRISEERLAQGLEPQNVDKEVLRLWFCALAEACHTVDAREVCTVRAAQGPESHSCMQVLDSGDL